VYAKPDHVAWVLDGPRAIVLHMESGEHIGLSETATEIWVLLMELGDLTAVVDALAARYDVDRGVLEGDAHALVEQLLAADLLARTEPDPLT
jgi:hypothetical protein